MKCQKCGSKRVGWVNAKCSDCCATGIDEKEQDGYVPDDLGIGNGDYVEFDFCFNCGQIQGKFPLPISILEDC